MQFCIAELCHLILEHTLKCGNAVHHFNAHFLLYVFFFLLMTYSMHVCQVISVMSDSLQPQGLQEPPGSSVHGILQAGILEWIAMRSSKGSSQPRYRTHTFPVAPVWQANSLSLNHWGSPSDLLLAVYFRQGKKSC